MRECIRFGMVLLRIYDVCNDDIVTWVPSISPTGSGLYMQGQEMGSPLAPFQTLNLCSHKHRLLFIKSNRTSPSERSLLSRTKFKLNFLK